MAPKTTDGDTESSACLGHVSGTGQLLWSVSTRQVGINKTQQNTTTGTAHEALHITHIIFSNSTLVLHQHYLDKLPKYSRSSEIGHTFAVRIDSEMELMRSKPHTGILPAISLSPSTGVGSDPHSLLHLVRTHHHIGTLLKDDVEQMIPHALCASVMDSSVPNSCR